MAASGDNHRIYSFAGFTLDVDRGALVRNGIDVKLRPKSFEVLRMLVERHGRLVSRQEILDAIWGRTVVTDDAVTQCLIDIRKAIGDSSQTMVRTVPRRGYLFDVPVTLTTVNAAPMDGNRAPRRKPWQFALVVAVVAVVMTIGGIWGISDRRMVPPQDAISEADASSYSIAVLPFLDMSENQDLEYFADGISEEILNVLVRVPELHVVARTSSFAFKDQPVDIATIRQKLNVTHVLEGSVRKSEERIRVTAQLVSATTGKHLWSETYDRTLSDIFAIQDDIAAAVVGQLAVSLQAPLATVRKTHPEAYRLFLQAQYLLDQLDFSRNAEAEQLLRRSIEFDPEFAPAWRELARVRWREIDDGPGVEEDIARLLETLQHALALDPDEAGTLAYLGWHVADFDGEIERGAELIGRALALDPGNEAVARAATLYSHALANIDDAIVLGEFGIARNPLCYSCHVQLVYAYIYGGYLAKAETAAREMQVIFDRPNAQLGTILLLRNKPEQALAAFAELDSENGLIGSALALYDLDRIDEAQLALTEYVELVGDEPSWSIAMAHAWMHRDDAAFAAMEKAAAADQIAVDGRIVRRNLQRISGATRDPLFQRLHDSPRWQAFLEQYGITAERLASVRLTVSLPEI